MTKKFEEEIQSLKSNNLYLNKALHEKNKNHIDLKKKSLKDENSFKLDSHHLEIGDIHHFEDLSIQSKESTRSDDSSSKKESINLKVLRNELAKQSLNFDQKLAELYEINEKIKTILNDLDI